MVIVSEGKPDQQALNEFILVLATAPALLFCTEIGYRRTLPCLKTMVKHSWTVLGQ